MRIARAALLRGRTSRGIVYAKLPVPVDYAALPQQREGARSDPSAPHSTAALRFLAAVTLQNFKSSISIRRAQAHFFELHWHCQPSRGWAEFLRCPKYAGGGVTPGERAVCTDGAHFIDTHSCIALHTWMISRVCITKNTKEHKLLQKELYRLLWDDTTKRMRGTAKVPELLISTNLRKMHQVTLENAAHLDVGYNAFLETSNDTELGSAIWRGLFKENDNIDDASIAATVEYVLKNVADLQALDDSTFLEAKYEWDCYPDGFDAEFLNVPRGLPSDGSLPNEWRRYYSDEGIDYEWNLRTRQSRAIT